MRSPCLLPCLAIVLLSTVPARAEEPRPESAPAPLEPKTGGVEERKILLPDLVSATYVVAGAGIGGSFAGPIYVLDMRTSDERWTRIGVNLGGDIVKDRWTYGAGVDAARGYSTSRYEESNEYSVAVQGRVGLLVPLDHGLSFWPRIGLGTRLGRTESTRVGTGFKSVTETTNITPHASIALVMPLSRWVFFRVEQSVAYTASFREGEDDTTDIVDVSGRAGLGVSF